MNKRYRKIAIAFLMFWSLIATINASILNDSIILPIIDVGYTKEHKTNTTKSFSYVRGEELNSKVVTSLSNSLVGKIAGLTTILQGGEPGKDAASLFIRGRGTYNNNSILVFVDGFQSAFEHILPNEIETITVLKDAAALANFGIEGANGVLWITTKRGIESPVKIQLQSKFVLQQPTKRISSLNSYDYAQLYNEANSNEKGFWSPIYSESAINSYKNNADPTLYPDVNWYNEVVKNSSPYYDVNLSFRGGSPSIKYSVFLGHQNSDMLYKDSYNESAQMKDNSKFKRYNFRANTDVKINTIFSLSADLGGMVANYARPAFSTATLWNNLVSYPSNIYPVKNPNGSWGGSAVYMDNPVASISATGINTEQERSIQANVKLEQDLSFLVSGLKFTEAVSFSDYFSGYYNKSKDYVRSQPYIGTDANLTYLSYGQNTGYDISDGVRDVWERVSFLVSADYEKFFEGDIFSARLAFNQNRYIIDGRNAPYFKQGVFGTFKYNKSQKYIAEFNYSFSGSENFMRGKRYGFFPALSAAWIISNESFFSKLEKINLLKIRASAGVVGNDNIGRRFLFQSYYAGNSANPYILGASGQVNQNTLAQSVVGNMGITWEKSYKSNIGLDMIVFDNLQVTFDAFYDKRTNIISQRNATVPSVFGNILPYENVGIVSNKGLELEVSYKNKIGYFSYHLRSLFSMSRNKIDYQEEPIRSENYLYRTGNPIGQPFGFVATGFYQIEDFDENGNLMDGLSIPAYPVQPGDIKYVDKNNDGFINENDYQAIGYGDLPEITYSLGTNLTYKNLGLNLFFQGVANRSVSLSGIYAYAFVNNTNGPEMAKGRWAYYPDRGIDTRSEAIYPRLSLEPNDNNYSRSTFWMKNGNFLRLRDVELSYTLNNKFAESMKIKGSRIFIGGSNLLTIRGITDYDPEVIGGYPLLKNYYLGININF